MTRLDECYERGLLRKVGASNDKALLSIAQAREWITEAGYDCDAGGHPGLQSWRHTWDISMPPVLCYSVMV